MILNINHMNVIVRDLSLGRSFVDAVLGLRTHPSYPGAYVVGADDPILVLLELPTAHVAPLEQNPHHRHRGITLLVDSLSELRARALDAGFAPFVMLDDGREMYVDSGGRLDHENPLCVRDHDQNLWRFVAA
jgi:catechol 2,3-dioxygenase-like lactoylglutathione lyase family enzyme